MASNHVSPSASVTLDVNGNGQVSLTPPSGTRWDLTLATVSTTSTVNESQASLYLGNANGPVQLIDSTFSGNNDSTDHVSGVPVYHGTYIWAVWAGGDGLTIATLQLYGQQVSGYRRAG